MAPVRMMLPSRVLLLSSVSLKLIRMSFAAGGVAAVTVKEAQQARIRNGAVMRDIWFFMFVSFFVFDCGWFLAGNLKRPAGSTS
jgi:hypothetical protein